MVETDLTASAWKALEQHYSEIHKHHLKNLFTQETDRFSLFSRENNNMLIDFSRNHINQHSLQLLLQLAKESKLDVAINHLLQGQIVNLSEERAALHTALRSPNMSKALEDTRKHIFQIVNQIQNQQWLGFTAKPITDIVNIGIGGSYLGPALAIEALEPYTNKTLNYHFLTNVDPSKPAQLLKKLNPETTLFIVVSKTFTTDETLLNTHYIKQWFKAACTDKQAFKKHFIAVTAYPERARACDFAAENILNLWDWVGGRYSVWSAAGLIAATALGEKHFTDFLTGAYQIDQHFAHAPLLDNIPVLMALLNIWYVNFFGAKTHAILPYCERLKLLPTYLQQLMMESNGKSCQQTGDRINYATSPIVWGGTGTDGQHTFHQLLFQGTHLIPSDFILVIKDDYQAAEAHQRLFANALAQAQLLMHGETINEIEQELMAKGCDSKAAAYLAKQKFIPGNQPSNLIILRELSPKTLGSLIALYEHKTYVESVIWKTNCFDQWGVESGKILAKKISTRLSNAAIGNENFDNATENLISYFKKHSNQP